MVNNEEKLIRLLFADKMTSSLGELTVEAFPVDELIERGGKSVSVDRCDLLPSYECIENKLVTYENPARGRGKWGYAVGVVSNIRSIVSPDGRTIFEALPDPLVSYPPTPWDGAHAKIVRADATFGKGFVRGYRDKLVDVFQAAVTKVF